LRASIDFETRSAVDLLVQPKRDDLAGMYNYASDPSTDVLCMAYSIDGAEPELWLPGDPIPACFSEDITAIAWNADFERCIWDMIMTEVYDAPPLRLEQWYCSAYASRCNNMPGALGNAARCLNVAQQKQTRGRELIKLLCIPLADGSFCTDPALLEEMYEYCLQDVRTEMAVMAQLREPTEREWLDYHVNCRINDRGVRIDRELCDAAQIYAKEEEAELIARIEELTEGVVTKARGEKLKDWVVERLTPEQEELLVKYRNGERKLSLDKYNRGRLLALDDMDPDVAEVVECSDFAQKSSVGKFRAMSRMADPEDHRVRGAFMANGASASGRYSSKGAQVHNFPRDGMKDPLAVRADMIDNIMAEDMVDYFGKPIMTILSHMLRSALIPADGHRFLVSDWSAIEGRVAPWLCNDAMGNAKLELYAENAPVYEITAAATFRMDVADVKNPSPERQVGKVQELAFQFGGGANAFLAMARGYGLKATRAEAEKYKDAWRRINPWAPAIWADIERAARLAVKNPGQMYDAGRLSYFAVEGVLAGGTTLFCQLPCGRLLTYPDVRIELKETPWGDVQPSLTTLRAAFVPKADEKEWPRSGIYGGLLFENAVQGTAASLLRYALVEADDRGLATVLDVHDEVVAETPLAQLDADKEILRDIMNTAPEWAADLPLHASVEVMERYGK
jgi:DNA polymerase